MRRTPGRGAPHRRGPPRAGARRAPHARPPTLRRSPEHGPDAPLPLGDLRRGRPSHRRDGWGPAGIAPPTVTAVPTALEAHERGGSPAAARQSVLVRAVIASYTQPTQIEIPIPTPIARCNNRVRNERSAAQIRNLSGCRRTLTPISSQASPCCRQSIPGLDYTSHSEKRAQSTNSIGLLPDANSHTTQIGVAFSHPLNDTAMTHVSSLCQDRGHGARVTLCCKAEYTEDPTHKPQVDDGDPPCSWRVTSMQPTSRVVSADKAKHSFCQLLTIARSITRLRLRAFGRSGNSSSMRES